MADVTYVSGERSLRTDWDAIWAGVFTFFAIWTVFGLLGVAVFASSANPRAASPIMGMSAGLGVWLVILTLIAMYVAGRETGRLAATDNRTDAAIHGMVMFGLSTVAVFLLIALGGAAVNRNTATATVNSTPYMISVFEDLGWIGFLSLLLGWLGAMGGAVQGIGTHRYHSEAQAHHAAA